MKTKLYLIGVLCSLFHTELSAQLKAHWEVGMNLGFCGQAMPTRFTRHDADATASAGNYGADTQYTTGMMGGLTIAPFKNKFVAYEFTPVMSLHWLGKKSGFTRNMTHKFMGGIGHFFGVIAIQHVKKMATVYEERMESGGKDFLYRSYSVYDSRRLCFGLRYSYGSVKENYLEALLCRESFTAPTKQESTGYSLTWVHGKTRYQIDYFPNHLARGNIYTTLQPSIKLPSTGMYLQLSIRADLKYRRYH